MTLKISPSSFNWQLAATRRPSFRQCLTILGVCLLTLAPGAQAAPLCRNVLEIVPADQLASYQKVLEVMERGAYAPDQLPQIPLRMWKFFGKQLSFFVGKRSKEILDDRRDFRQNGLEKPIHPMGVGLQGRLRMNHTRWSGVFAGGEFPVLARASISQGNALETAADGSIQKRSTAMAIKVFPTHDLTKDVRTANAVFQNDLNGLKANDGTPLRFLDSPQTNQPNLNFMKIRESYEVLTLVGVAFGSLTTPKDRMAKFPYINPQIRPVHSWAEVGVTRSEDVRLPTWVKIRPKLKESPVNESDFRLEITKTLERDGVIVYEVLAADARDDRGMMLWESVGEITFDRAILSEGVDRNLLFPHDSLNSRVSKTPFELPEPRKQHRAPFEDVQ